MIGFGVLGYLLRKLDVPLVPIILGILLGNQMEDNLRRALTNLERRVVDPLGQPARRGPVDRGDRRFLGTAPVRALPAPADPGPGRGRSGLSDDGAARSAGPSASGDGCLKVPSELARSSIERGRVRRGRASAT